MRNRRGPSRAVIVGAFAAGAVAAVSVGLIWSRKWALEVRYAGGETDFLRSGPSAGEGPVAWFRFRREAEDMLAALRPALADNAAVRVTRYY